MHGQEVNIDFWVVKNLDPGRERMYRVNGSDLPLSFAQCFLLLQAIAATVS